MQAPLLPTQPSYLPPHYLNQFSILQHETYQAPNICNVWVYNFEHELAKISELLENYPIISMVSNVISTRIWLKTVKPAD